MEPRTKPYIKYVKSIVAFVSVKSCNFRNITTFVLPKMIRNKYHFSNRYFIPRVFSEVSI